jgi:hypothetical protein
MREEICVSTFQSLANLRYGSELRKAFNSKSWFYFLDLPTKGIKGVLKENFTKKNLT